MPISYLRWSLYVAVQGWVIHLYNKYFELGIN